MIISHDLGTTGDKATLVSNDGEVLAAVTSSYGTDFGPRGKAEQDPEDWWTALCAATQDLLRQASVRAEDIEVVSFSGQMMGAVLLDQAGAPVRPAIIWADTRSVAQTATLVDRVGMAEGYKITGHRLNPTYSLSKIMWVRDQEPEVFARARTVVLAKDFVAYRLTGVLATDPSDASSTNAYDQAAGEWSTELIEAADLPRSLFPDIVPSTAVIGPVTAEAARATGLMAGTPVVMGGGDGPMGALGAGIIAPESGAYAYLGSSSWVSVAADAPLHDPQMRSMTFNHVLPGRYVPTATMQAGGASLEWVIDVLAPGQEDRYERLLAEAADVSAQRGRPVLPAPPAGRAVALLEPGGPGGLRRPRSASRTGAPDPGRARGRGVQPLHRPAGLCGERHPDRRGRRDRRRRELAVAPADLRRRLGRPGDQSQSGRRGHRRRCRHRRRGGCRHLRRLRGGRPLLLPLTSQTPEPARHERYGREYALFMEAYTRLEPWFDKL